MAKRRRRRKNRYRWARRLGWFTLWVAGGLAIASIAVTAVFRWLDPPISAFMLHKRASAEQAYPLHYRWVDAAAISPSLAIAVVAAEDQRFPTHSGFDVDSIIEALRDAVSRGRLRGASTISQQVAKNLFLWPERSFARKGLEAWFTVWIETLWPKGRILEVYLNLAEFGPGVFGAQAASEFFFGLNAYEIDEHEAALLAAVLPNPRRLKVHAPSDYVRGRQDWILSQMRLLGGPSYLKNGT